MDSKEGKNLIIRRILIREPNGEERSKTRALFRIRCKIMGKVCRIIIDSGSTKNRISEEVVEKMKLERLLHANPYKVTWLNK